MVYWDKFGRPEREGSAVYGPPQHDAWWYDAEKARRLAGTQSNDHDDEPLSHGALFRTAA